MRKSLVLAIAAMAILVASYVGTKMVPPQAPAAAGCQRIVSLAPSITETLFALGLGDRVVGVTRFCTYPPEAAAKPRVGGYLDPSYEAIVALKPDLVVTLEEHQDARNSLEAAGLQLLAVNHKTIDGIRQSIDTIGRQCGCEFAAEALGADIHARMKRVQEKTAGLGRPRVVISIGRSMGTGGLKDATIAGKEGFYDTMLDIAGAVNAYDGPVRFPVISAEGLLTLKPDVIIDIVAGTGEAPPDADAALRDWQALKGMQAGEGARVVIFTADYALSPGPRFIRTIEDIARAVHPEADWD